MRDDRDEKRRILAALYGVDFPEGLFLFDELLAELGPELASTYLGAAGLTPTGPLALLDRSVDDLRALRPTLPMVLNWRYYRDLPEFFTCLHGDTDGLHWGLLLDEPDRGFRGAASYYNNDGDEIGQYASLFDAVLVRVKDGIEGAEEMIEDDPEYADDYREDVGKLEAFRDVLTRFVAERGVRRDERRPSGLRSDTGLSLVLPAGALAPGRLVGAHELAADPEGAPELIRSLIADCASGSPVPALHLGRSLYYWGGATWSSAAHGLLGAAYVRLERPALLRVLDAHFTHRDLGSVDILRDAGGTGSGA